jgi:hypothetical protein
MVIQVDVQSMLSCTASGSSFLHSSYGRVLSMVGYIGFVGRMFFQGLTCVQDTLVGGWMEKHFRRVSNILSGHIGKHTKIAST